MAKPIATATNPYSSAPLANSAIPTTVALTGAGTDPDGGSITGWKWYILSKPSGSSASLSDDEVQSPNLLNVDVWGNYRLLLVVTDSSAEESETDPVQAPDSALTVVRVAGPGSGVQRIAPGERNYIDVLNAWPYAIETLWNAFADHGIEDHDGTVTTGSELDLLSQGGYATDDGLSTGTSLHIHPGSAVDVASVSAPGVVLLDEAPVSAGAPKAVTRDRVYLNGFRNDTLRDTGTQLGVIAIPETNGESESALDWTIPEAMTLVSYHFRLHDGGKNGESYEFKVYAVTETQFKANDWGSGTLLQTITMSQSSSGGDTHKPTTQNVASASDAISAGLIVAVVCTGEPATELGGGLSVTIRAVRKV